MLEKMDHLGIVVLIVGTPITQIMAMDPKGCRRVLWCSCMGLLVSAFLPAVPRVIAFVGIGAIMVAAYTHILNTSLLLQCFLYVAGAVSFIRNGGHERLPWGLTDHHLLHYKVTVACAMHVINIRQLTAKHGTA